MYTVDVAVEAELAVEALPQHALAAYAELLVVLETAPLSGELINPGNPTANIRTHTFGPHHEGIAFYFTLEEQRRVSLLRLIWVA